MLDSRKPQLDSLTGLRFLAAGWVAAFHLRNIALARTPPEHELASGWLAGIENILRAGPAGVALFFVLSGFVLTYSYGDPLGHRPVDRRRFFVARFARIYPVYALGLLLGLVPWLESVPWHRLPPGSTAINVGGVGGATVLLLQSWVPRMAHRWNSVGWSLSAEAFFYLCFPLLMPLLARCRDRRLLALAVSAYCVTMVAAVAGWTSRPELEGFVYYHPLLRLGDFVLGIVAGQLFLRRRIAGDGGMLVRLTSVTALLIAAVLALSDAIPMIFVQNSLLAPAFALLVYQLAWQRGRLASVLRSRPLVLLGESSYAIYLLHMLLFTFGFAVLERFDVPFSIGSAFGLCLVVVMSSVAVYRWYEEPLRRRIRRRWSSRSDAVHASEGEVQPTASMGSSPAPASSGAA